MKYKLQNIIDIEQFQNLQDKLNEIYSFPSAIIDNDGNILTATAWQEICEQFHRKNKDSERHCIQSDQYILSHIHEANPAVSYRCPHGLVDNATPIIINGIHYGNFFTGQFFLEEPNIDFFRTQAKKYGFNEKAYIEAVRKVPIWTQEQLNNYIFFIKGLIAVISESGLKKLKEMEHRKQLEKSEEHHRSIIQTALDGFWLTDTKGQLLEVNESYCRMSGYREDELLSMNIADLEAHENPQNVHKHLQKTIAKGSDRFETKHCRKDGTVFDVEVSFQFRNDEGGRCVSFLRDISERKLADHKLLESEEHIGSILRSAPVGIGSVIDRKINKANYRLCEMTGYDEGELIGQSAKILYPGDKDFEFVGREKYAQIKDHGTGTVETHWRRKNGTIVNVLLSSTPVDFQNYSKGVTFTALDITERKLAEQALRESEAHYHSIFANSLIGITVTDRSFIFTDTNDSFCKMLEYSREEIVGKMTISDISHPDDVAKSMDMVNKLMRHDIDHYTIEKRFISKTGKTIPVLVYVRGHYSPEGEYEGTTASSLDMTERKMADELLRQNEEKYRSLFNNSEIAMFRTRLNGSEILDCNQKFLDLVGTNREETLGKPSAIFWADQEERREMVRRLVENDSVSEYEFRMLHKHEGVRNCVTSLRHYREQGILEGSISDITERKQAEEALRENEERYRHLFNISNDAVFVHLGPAGGIPGCFIEVNKVACERLGYMREELVQMSPPEIDAPETLAKVPMIMEQLFQHGHVSWEGIHLAKDGRRIPVEITNQLFDYHGTQMILSTARDITERKRAEEEREKLQSQLNQAQKMESVGRLAGGVAHDFNNMLCVILGHVEMAMDEMNNDHLLFNDLREIHNAAQRSTDITRQLLAFARKQTIAPKVIDLNPSVEGILKMLQRLIGEDVTLIWKPGYKLWTVKIDSSQLDQILANLCVNARDAISDVGTITIETSNFVFDEEYCKRDVYFVAGDYVMLAMSDTGCGMDNTVLEHIFEPFYTTKDIGKGTGLGLATVYGIVKQNNGFIKVSSEPGRGTTFKIYLPRHISMDQARTEASSKPAKGGHETILLVEDEPTILNMTSIMLQRLGYSVTAVGTPEEAIQVVEDSNDKIHLLITDLIMPKMNGKDLSEKLLIKKPEMQILFMSGYTANVIAHRGVLDEGVHFIQKPFSKEDLASKIRMMLD